MDASTGNIRGNSGFPPLTPVQGGNPIKPGSVGKPGKPKPINGNGRNFTLGGVADAISLGKSSQVAAKALAPREAVEPKTLKQGQVSQSGLNGLLSKIVSEVSEFAKEFFSPITSLFKEDKPSDINKEQSSTVKAPTSSRNKAPLKADTTKPETPLKSGQMTTSSNPKIKDLDSQIKKKQESRDAIRDEIKAITKKMKQNSKTLEGLRGLYMRGLYTSPKIQLNTSLTPDKKSQFAESMQTLKNGCEKLDELILHDSESIYDLAKKENALDLEILELGRTRSTLKSSKADLPLAGLEPKLKKSTPARTVEPTMKDIKEMRSQLDAHQTMNEKKMEEIAGTFRQLQAIYTGDKSIFLEGKVRNVNNAEDKVIVWTYVKDTAEQLNKRLSEIN